MEPGPYRFYYQAFGLIWGSDVALPELLPCSSSPVDVAIRFGEVPDSLEDAVAQGVCYQVAARRFLLTVETTARYLVQDGREIVIAPCPNAEDDSIRLFLLCSALGALLHQREMLPLHAGAIVVDGSAVAFLGRSGAGKSTLVAAFQQRGYPILSDDISVVTTTAEEVPTVYPGYPQLKLWEDTLRKLDVDPHTLRPVREGLMKYGLRLEEAFHAAPRPLRRLYVLSMSSTEPLHLTRLKGKEGFQAILRNTYRPRFIDPEGKAAYFDRCVAIGRHVVISEVTRPLGEFQLEALVSLLEKDLVA